MTLTQEVTLESGVAVGALIPLQILRMMIAVVAIYSTSFTIQRVGLLAIVVLTLEPNFPFDCEGRVIVLLV